VVISLPFEPLLVAVLKPGNPASAFACRISRLFNFFRIQNGAAMPDHVPLFGLELDTREQFVSLLKARGLEVE
jgi:hypothetical protein